MKALALDYEHSQLELRDVPEPGEPAPGQVLFRIAEGGICGTDRDLARFRFGYPPAGDSFLILGHEAVGQVVASRSPQFAAGDWVVPTVRRGCGQCSLCGRNRSDLCVTFKYTERGIMGAHGYLADYAVDHATHLVRVPSEIADVAVLAEPLSVVEKAIDRAAHVRGEPAQNALVIGAGPIGILSALLFQSRGVGVTVQSLEAPDHPRARLVDACGARFTNQADEQYDIVIEAAGNAAAAYNGLRRLGPLGVCVLLGAQVGSEEIQFRDLILGNQAVIGSVNSSPESFAAAVADLAKFERSILSRMIERSPLEAFRDSFSDTGADSVKQVHVLN